MGMRRRWSPLQGPSMHKPLSASNRAHASCRAEPPAQKAISIAVIKAHADMGAVIFKGLNALVLNDDDFPNSGSSTIIVHRLRQWVRRRCSACITPIIELRGVGIPEGRCLAHWKRFNPAANTLRQLFMTVIGITHFEHELTRFFEPAELSRLVKLPRFVPGNAGAGGLAATLGDVDILLGSWGMPVLMGRCCGGAESYGGVLCRWFGEIFCQRCLLGARCKSPPPCMPTPFPWGSQSPWWFSPINVGFHASSRWTGWLAPMVMKSSRIRESRKLWRHGWPDRWCSAARFCSGSRPFILFWG